MPDIADIVAAAFTAFPILTIVLVAMVIFQLFWYFVRRAKTWSQEISPEFRPELEKPKNDDLNLALLAAPEKPKNMFVRLGDDGELVEWSDQHETNS